MQTTKEFKKKGGSGEWNKGTGWSAEVLAFTTTVMLKSLISHTSLKAKWQFKRLSGNSDLFRRCSFYVYVTGQI